MPITCEISLTTGLQPIGIIVVEVPASALDDPMELMARLEAGMKAFERSFEEWGDGQS